jgi:sirohydrochlorin cobaltochelatase
MARLAVATLGCQMAFDALVLVGHGAAPTDCPPYHLFKLRQLQGRRRALGGDRTPDEIELEERVRNWPRHAENDPYRAGLELVAEALRGRLPGARVLTAYLELCPPSLDEAVVELASAGATRIVIVPSMMTPGGVHSEKDIPEALEVLRVQHPKLTLIYTWPFDPALVAGLIASQVEAHVAQD